MIESPSPRPAGAASVIVLVGALTAASVWWRPAGAALWLDVATGVLSLGAAVAQMWWPVSGALAATLLAAVSPAATPVATTGVLQVAQRKRFVLAAGVTAAGFGAHLVRALWRPTPGISLGWWLVLICATYGALLGWGALARSRRALLISLHERAVRAEAEQGRRVAEARMAERRTLAREMHDVLAHRLSLVATHAGALEYRPDASPEKVAKAAGIVRAGVHQALEELREVIGLLHEDDIDAETAPQPTLADLPRLIEEARDAGQSVDFRDELGVDAARLPDAAFPPAIGRAAYRVVQEGLTNARKHAPGQPVEVLLYGTPDARLIIDVSNTLLGEVTQAAEAALSATSSATTAAQVHDARAGRTASATSAQALHTHITQTPSAPKAQSPRARTAQTPRADVPQTPRADVPQTPRVNAPHADAPRADAPRADAPRADAPRADAPRVNAPRADVPQRGVDVSVSGMPGAGVGLVGLTERVRLAGGQLDHWTSEGRFVLRAWLPWPRDPGAAGR
ncbi:histidine kinase [Spirillospora sp. NPDC052269]